MIDYRVVIAKSAHEFEDKLRRYGEEGFRIIDRWLYFQPRGDKPREYVAVMEKDTY